MSKTIQGNVDWRQLKADSRQGDGDVGVSFGGGAVVEGDRAVFDATGAIVAGGAAAIHGFGATLTPSAPTAYIVVPTGGTINAWSILVDAGTATIKVWRVAAGTALPTGSNSINTSGVSISSGTAVESTDVSDFTSTAINDGDIIGIHLQASSGASMVVFQAEFA